MQKQWEYLQEGQSIGPIDEDDLRTLLGSGALKSSTPIRCSDVGEIGWKPALAVPEFRGICAGRQEPSAPKTEPPLAEAQESEPSRVPELPLIQSPLPVALTTQTRPIEATTSRKDAQSVVNWMWGLTFASWASCFIPIPGVSTLFVWIFACFSSLVAFVALFKSRVGSGIAGLAALAFVTPVIWLFATWLYAMLLTKSVVDAEQMRLTQGRARTPQSVVREPKQVLTNVADPRVARAKELMVAGRAGDGELASLVEQGLPIATVLDEATDRHAAWTVQHQICMASGEKSASMSRLVRAIAAQSEDLSFSCFSNGDPAWAHVAGSQDVSLLRDLLSRHISAWSARNKNKSYLNYVAGWAIVANRRDVLLELKEHGLPLAGAEATFCRTEMQPGSMATNNIPTEERFCYNALHMAVKSLEPDLVSDLLAWGADPNVMSEDSRSCNAALSSAENAARPSEYGDPSNVAKGKMLVDLLLAHGAVVRCPADWVPPSS